MTQREGLLKRDWEETQIKVFSRWVAKQLLPKAIQFETVREDYANGVNLIYLIEALTKQPFPTKYNKTPKLRFHFLENTKQALSYITDVLKIRLIGIGSEDVIDKNLKLTLGLTWSIIQKYQIEDISVEEATARDALMIWAKKNTAGYEGVNVVDFSKSWSSGLAFCALINKFRPNVLDYNALDKADEIQNCKIAFEACKTIGVYVYLDPEDLVGIIPDEKSVVTQVAEFFHFFASESKILVMANKVKGTLSLQKQIDEFFSTYQEEAKAAMDLMIEKEGQLSSQDYQKTVPGVKAKLVEVIKYGRDSRPKIVELRGKAIRTWGVMVTKCKSSSRHIPEPPVGFSTEDLNTKFQTLETIAPQRRSELTIELKDLQNQKLQSFEAAASKLVNQSEKLRDESNKLEGTSDMKIPVLEKLITEAEALQTEIPTIQAPFDELVELKLNTRTKFTVLATKEEADKVLLHLNHLLQQNRAAKFSGDNEARIAAYNAKAMVFDGEVQNLSNEIKAISGSIAERRTQLLSKSEEVVEKRSHVVELNGDFQALSNDGLHYGIENTPEALQAKYTAQLGRVLDDLKVVYDEMIASFDQLTQGFIARTAEISAAAGVLEGSFTEQKSHIEGLFGKAKIVQGELPTLDAPYEELVQFKIAPRAKYSPMSVRGEVEQLITLLNKLSEQNIANLFEESNGSRVSQYNSLSLTFFKEAEEYDASVKAINGSRAERRSAYIQKQEEVSVHREKLNELTPHYQALEKDGLHIGVEHTPSSISASYTATLAYINLRLGEIFREMVADFDSLAGEIVSQIGKLTEQAQSMAGSFTEQKSVIEGLVEQHSKVQERIPELSTPYDELVEFKITTRAKFSPNAVKGESEQLHVMLKTLTEQNAANLFEESNNHRIAAYNTLSNEFQKEADEFNASVKAIAGERKQRLDSYLQKQSEVSIHREKLNELVPPYQDLEKDSLHTSVNHTPNSISSFYASTIAFIGKQLGDIYKEMVSEFDAKCHVIVAKNTEIFEASRKLSGSLEEQKVAAESLLKAAQELEPLLPELDAPHAELVEYKLQFLSNEAINDVKGNVQQLVSNLTRLIQTISIQIVEDNNNQRVSAYNTRATECMNKAKTMEESVSAVEGSLEQKNVQLLQLRENVSAHLQAALSLVPEFEELERDELHLEIEITPDTITAYINNVIAHVDTLVAANDSAIALSKGLEISEEQLTEFRSSFAHFDKDNSQTLEYFELRACLTTLGEDISDDEAKEICRKYGDAEGHLHFENYAKFMVEYFSKKETADSTKDAFKAITSNNPIITEEQLKQYFSPEEAQYLESRMPKVENGYDFSSWADSIFA